jgi:hypothetical protein
VPKVWKGRRALALGGEVPRPRRPRSMLDRSVLEVPRCVPRRIGFVPSVRCQSSHAGQVSLAASLRRPPPPRAPSAHSVAGRRTVGLFLSRRSVPPRRLADVAARATMGPHKARPAAVPLAAGLGFPPDEQYTPAHLAVPLTVVVAPLRRPADHRASAVLRTKVAGGCGTGGRDATATPAESMVSDALPPSAPAE